MQSNTQYTVFVNWNLLRDNVDSPVFSALLTLVAFQVGLSLYRLSNNRVWLHPVLIGAMVIAGGLKLVSLNYSTYLTNCTIVMFFLGPLIVALAVPLMAELTALRGIAIPALITVLFGSFAAPLTAIGCAYLMGADEQVLLSLVPKSVTSPIAINLSEIVGGLVAFSAAITVFTGIIGALMAPIISILDLMRIVIIRIKTPLFLIFQDVSDLVMREVRFQSSWAEKLPDKLASGISEP